MVGQRQADRHLTVVPLAELAAVLTRHPNRMAAFLRKPGVVDDPGLDRAAAFDDRQGQLLYPAENPLVRPRCVGDKMQQRLVLGRDPRRRRYRRDRLDALALARQQQAPAIIMQRLPPDRHARSPQPAPRRGPQTVPAGPRSCPASPRKCSLRVARTVTSELAIS